MEPVEEWFQQYEATRLLVTNLQINLEQLTKLKPKEISALMRMNLIMIRQCLQDFGVE